MTPKSSADGVPPAPTRTADDSIGRLAAGARLAGRYRILELVGLGGMGMVYKAEDEQLGLPVAIKVLRPDLARDGRRIERFKQELVLGRQVSHPNVVRIHDIGSDGDLVFLSMDFVPGRSLGELLAAEGPLTADRAVGIARQVAAGLAAAHDAGVVHRDLKPGNILIDDSGRAAISDFGIARSLGGPGATLPGSVVGTLDYLSPEQARGGEIDGRTDLYALGILLHEMLTGELPFAGGSATEVLAQRLTGSTRELLPAEVPRQLAAVIRRLLQRDPDRRPASAGEVLEELGNLHVQPSPWRRVGWAALAILALAALGFAVYQGIRLVRKEPAAPAAAAGHAVALLPLADQTGREDLAWVASGLPEMLSASLAEGPGLRVLDSQRVFDTLEALKLAPGPLPEREARRLAELLDADRLVSGQVRATGNRLRIDLSLVATDLPGLPAQTIRAESEPREAFNLIDQLGATLRERLAAPPLAPLAPAIASRSPAALSAYAKGSASLHRGDALSAATDLERAVASDPGYGAAWVQLARARESLGRREAAREAARRAVASLGEEEGRSAYEARAVEARLLGHPEKAQELLARLVERYPDDAEARVELAEAYGEQGSLDRAIAALREVVRLAPHHPRAWFLLAKYSILAGDVRRAIDDYLVRALVVQNQLGSEEGRADVLNAFGVAWRDLGEMERAAESWEQAAAIRKRIGDERGYATTLRNLASLDSVRGEHAAAERKLGEALAILERLGDGLGIADLQDEFGVLAEERGHYEEALSRYQQALRVRRDLGNDVAFATSFANVGYACYLLGRYDDAMVYWSQGLDLARKSGDPAGVVLATQNLGLLELAKGDWDRAVKSFLEALGKSRELDMKQATASSLGHLGRLAQYQGRPAAALASFAEALAVLREIDDHRGLAEFTLAQAEVEIELGMEKAAGQHLQAAAELLSAEKSREQQAELERLRGEHHLLRGERDAARAVLRRAVADARESHSVVELLDVRLSERPPLAELERLQSQAEALGHARLRLRAAEAVTRAALGAGDTELAQQAAKAGLERADACGGYSGAWRLHLLLARAHERGGRRAEAEAERERARAEIARVGRELAPGQRESFLRLAEVQELDPIEVSRPAGRKD
ncbi:MAG: eukaryotic-like serine/threonine-protein kinase [Acidobacteriota bacterium]|jgi:tetratricopeptide (TPR) repeat protein|nr:eukaryotic-like serine/threonine-protein kinase [Acidobacteriota bacterium]